MCVYRYETKKLQLTYYYHKLLQLTFIIKVVIKNLGVIDVVARVLDVVAQERHVHVAQKKPPIKKFKIKM